MAQHTRTRIVPRAIPDDPGPQMSPPHRRPLRGWLRGLRSGDREQVFDMLFASYQRPLITFVLGLTGGDRYWAEDVVQETMIRAWRNVSRLDPEAESLMPWLATVARRIVIDDRRRRESRPRETGDGPLESMPVPDGMEDLLRTVVVSEALQTLSPAHREALTETVLRGRTVNEAAEALGVPVGTVKSRVYYGLKALRVALEEMGVES